VIPRAENKEYTAIKNFPELFRVFVAISHGTRLTVRGEEEGERQGERRQIIQFAFAQNS